MGDTRQIGKENAREIRSIVLRTVKPGLYKGLVANEVGKDCVRALVYHLKAQLCSFSSMEVVRIASFTNRYSLK